mmetsp:Transcript_29529/g.87356  ORF Transcript_29529/g.87356 Transcript_29529/m.87356 type:complete len:146 (-) Transcript_29529:90-527(-)
MADRDSDSGNGADPGPPAPRALLGVTPGSSSGRSMCSLRESCLLVLIRYRAALSDVGDIDACSIRDVCAHCSAEELAVIEDCTRRVKRRLQRRHQPCRRSYGECTALGRMRKTRAKSRWSTSSHPCGGGATRRKRHRRRRCQALA